MLQHVMLFFCYFLVGAFWGSGEPVPHIASGEGIEFVPFWAFPKNFT